ncbi:MAG: S8 family serine peptidase [Planctomycetes bacterium]|nr:S8 family serine peptidase [Planctomycetota bacterium]
MSKRVSQSRIGARFLMAPLMVMTLAGMCSGALGAMAADVARVSNQGGVSVIQAANVEIARTQGAVRNLRQYGQEVGAAALVWQEGEGAQSREMYAFTRDGQSWSRPIMQDASRDLAKLNLRWQTFDPTVIDHASIVPVALATPESPVYLAQFVVPPFDGITDPLVRAGVDMYAALPDSAMIVRAEGDGLAALRASPFLRALIPYHAVFKTEPNIIKGYLPSIVKDDAAAALARSDFEANWAKPYSQAMESLRAGGKASFWIQVHQPGLVMKEKVARAISEWGGVVQDVGLDDYLMRAELNQEQFVRLLGLAEVAFSDPWSMAETDMDIERTLMGANAVETATGFSGEGVRAEVMDSGVRNTHVALTAANVRLNNTGDMSHGTSTFGILFGTGASNTAARALLPDAEAKYFYAYSGLQGFGGTASRLTVTQTSVNTNNIVVQSNSWGSALTTAYTTTSQAMDNIIWQTGLLICQSQSNAGTQNSRPEAWAKNVLAVGGVVHGNDTNRTNDNWTNGASIGPAADGRVKPELANHYDNVLTTSSSSDTSYTTTFSGTSSATPITAGYMGLIFQMWHGGIFPGFGQGASVFASRPSFATARALAIHSAYRYNWTTGGSNASINRNVQGWGVIDIERLRQLGPSMYLINESRNLLAGQSATYSFEVPQGAPNLAVTMVYRDPPGTTSATIHRINDVSVKVTAPDGQFYWGNSGLSAGSVTSQGGTANTRDTVENVFLTAPRSGRWTVQVFADVVAADGDARTVGVNDVTFALAVSGGARTPVRVLSLDAARSAACGDGTLLSLSSGPAYARIREWMADPQRFGGAGAMDRPVNLLPAVSAISPATLANADVLVLTQPASALSRCEQGYLERFVTQGGGVVALYDDAPSDLASVIGASAGVSGVAGAFATNGSSGPVLAGPFGAVTGPVAGGAHGTFASVGTGTALLTSAAGVVSGLFTVGSGRAVIVGDGEWASDAAADCVQPGLPLTSNERFFLNALAAVSPNAPITYTFPSCAADFNCDSQIDFFDYLDFVSVFSSGGSGADFNQDGVVDFFDYLDFVSVFAAPC